MKGAAGQSATAHNLLRVVNGAAMCSALAARGALMNVKRLLLTDPQRHVTAGPAGRRPISTGVWVMLGVFGYLAAILFASPRTPYLLGGDQMFFWLDALRLLSGQHIYRDFLQFTPPGTDLVFWSLFKLLGPRIWVTNLTVLALGMALCALSFRLASHIMPPARAALATALVAVLVYGKWLDATHHWFSALAVLGALAVLMRSTTVLRVAAAGALLAVAAFFTQTRGPAAAIAIAAVLGWQSSVSPQPWGEAFKRQGVLLSTMALTWLALSSYYMVTVGPLELWQSQVDFVHQYMLGSKTITNTAGAWEALSLESTAVLTFYVLPLVYAIALWICLRGTQLAPQERSAVLLLAATGAAMLLEMVFSPNILRASCVAAPGLILLAWLTAHRSGRAVKAAAAVLWAAVLASAAHQVAARHLEPTAVLQLPAGRAAVRALPAEKLSWLAAHTRPGEPFFDAAWLGPYLPLGLRNPLFLDDVGGYMFRDSQTPGAAKLAPAAGQRLRTYVQHSAQQLLTHHVKYVVWQPRLTVPPFRVPVLRAFLQEHYTKRWTFSDQDEVWEINETASPPAGPAAMSTPP